MNRPAHPACLTALALAAALLTALPAASSAADADAIVGVWRTADGKAHIRLFRDGNAYHGEIVWMGEPLYPADDPGGMAGKPRIDRENPDPKLRQRPLLGLRLVEGLEHAGDRRWQGGRIYDPETGKTYKSKAEVDRQGNLQLRGFIGFSLLGRTTTWTRVPETATTAR